MISIIVCTYNRSEMLNQCIRHISEAKRDDVEALELLIIDNGSEDDTKQVVSKWMDSLPFPVKYFRESSIGLSHARNKGADEATGDWLFFLDDDGFLHRDGLQRMAEMIHSGVYDLFGGSYQAIYLDPPPHWLPAGFGTKKIKATVPGDLNEDTIEGGIMVMKKKVWQHLGGFNPDFGMKGSRQGFGEETEFVNRAITLGYRAGIHPGFSMDHVVGKHKFSLLFQLNSYAALARDMAAGGRPLKLSPLRVVLFTLPRLLKYGLRLIYNRGYYWQNAVWDVLSPLYFIGGYLKGTKIRKS